MAQVQVDPKVSIQIEVPEDRHAKRNKGVRWLIDGVLVLLTLYTPWRVALYVGGQVGHPVIAGFAGAIIGIWLLARLAPRLIIDNPEWSAYVTLDPLLGGHMVPYGPGIHLAFPWEERNTDGNYSLQVITRPFSLTTPTLTSAVTVSGRLFYNASLPYITNAIGVDKEVVEDGLIAFIDSNLISKLGGMATEDAVMQIPDISKELNDTFRDTVTPTGKKAEEFEKKFGYSTAAIVIDKIALPEAVQKAADAESEAKKMNKIALALLGLTQAQLDEMLRTKVITMKQLKEVVDRALVTSGNATMNLNVIEGNMANAMADFLTKNKQGR